MNKLDDKRILLTGATGGIGQAVLQQLLVCGAKVIITGRDSLMLNKLAGLAPEKINTFAGDLTDDATRRALLAYCQQLGGIDMLINNAGISQFSAANDQQLQTLVNTNLLSPMLLTQLFLPMLRLTKGTILNVGSTFGSIGYAGFTGYCATKFGLRGYTEALKRELADTGVRVLYLAPRATRTAINSPQVDALNQALGQGVDTADFVAKALVEQLQGGRPRRFLGMAENVFVRVNALFPAVVDHALSGKLKQIKQFFIGTGVKNSAEV
ncbi:SDR family oxidoreductase [Rheinheimera baltica]|uniref:SDR family oxidoreductase n=1 Tax=Rheinheimera baltica TaxID=67576 RepID=UPI0004142936|nr:SDR family oxidoreductase [Rheinheimera baltica]MDP5144491.1 SDR family oxidoreductase [Rheinheimera baltica]MDP5149095.1 SDR family oxidoreductase [Rheinheimera baltica]MDP5190396.1 SDR family oxidoreductase [Rheinheimera baltica]